MLKDFIPMFCLLGAGAVGYGLALYRQQKLKEELSIDGDLLEAVASVEHEQWMTWAKQVSPEVSPERRERWQKFMVPYKDLDEATKELDREWARKILYLCPCHGELPCLKEDKNATGSER
jgi:hypothetical protein